MPERRCISRAQRPCKFDDGSLRWRRPFGVPGVALNVQKRGLPESALTLRPNCVSIGTNGFSDQQHRRCFVAQITLNEGLAWLKTLKKRHEELITLRNDNAHRERRFYGSAADRELVREPVYDVKVLDKAVTRVAREIRLLEQAMKAANAKTVIDGYDQDDAVLGELT